ncbi:UDP-N-acetylglucosamine 2-epimerase [bioreactor metagenome]|uniref:UDP-N-acetylglucosamine 2-epimerase n=1 Tax=bioreactor metagenome TaxID=1076179 RepID=A0A645AMB9_9ZZZZ
MLEQKKIDFNPLINCIKPLGFNDYIKLQLHSKAVLSDSGTISEEASILGFKALNLREAHERPEAMEEAYVMMTGLKTDRIMQALTILEKQNNKTLCMVHDYAYPNVSEKVIRIIISYTDYINRNVWRKMD